MIFGQQQSFKREQFLSDIKYQNQNLNLVKNIYYQLYIE
jgi:hypothetical protein